MVYASYVENGHASPNGGYVQPRDVIAGSRCRYESRASELLRSFISNLLEKKELSSADIVDIIYTHIRTSELAKEVPTLYKYKHFLNPSGEFIVVAPLVNVINNSQIANVNVNIYVPDQTPTLDRKEQRILMMKG